MTDSVDELQQLIESHLAGVSVAVPEALRDEFDKAVAAHCALRAILDETELEGQSTLSSRLPPDLSGAYEIERELGHGGMGVVYLARQRSLNRQVALKVLRPGEQAFGSLLKRFLHEAQHLATLRHPNIVAIHEVGEAAGEPYFTMDFIDGEPLSAVLARGPLSPTQAVEILKQVAAAIQHAHRQGIIHRDLKPGNVLLDRAGHVFVTDFGLARNVSQESNLTQTGDLLGTPQYMAPEQARGQTSLIGEATDIHALGLLLFEMLTGQPAFAARSPADVLVKLLHEDPPAMRTKDRRVPRDLETICQKALRKAPEARYANVSALLEDVRRFEAGEPLLAKRNLWLTKVARWSARRWKPAVAVLITAVLVGLLAPRWFDKSFEDLMAWGDEELRTGRPQVAAQIFERAWQRSAPTQHEQVLPRLAETIRVLDDAQEAVDLALKVVKQAPQATFGKHDFLVAQALVVAARAATPNGAFEPIVHDSADQASVATRELAARRLSLFLEGPWGTAQQRREAEQWLLAIRRSMEKSHPTERWTFDEVVQLPQGTLEQLQQQISDAGIPQWNRGKAAMAAGRLREAAGNTSLALADYQRALELMRPVFPFVSGVASSMQATIRSGRDAEAPECHLMRELLDAIHRLDPMFVEPTAGGIALQVDRPELLAGMDLAVKLTLCDDELDNPFAGLSRMLVGHVAIEEGKSKPIHVLDGTYRLTFIGTSLAFTPNTSYDSARMSLLDISASELSGKINISGSIIELPPLSVRQLSEMQVLSPAEMARVNVNQDRLSWELVEGAASYEVQLGYFSDLPAPTSTWFTTIATNEPSLAISELGGRDREVLQRNWSAGRIAGLRVAAYDEARRCIARSIQDRRFLIAIGL